MNQESFDELFRGALIEKALADKNKQRFMELTSPDWKKYAFRYEATIFDESGNAVDIDNPKALMSDYYVFCDEESGKVNRFSVPQCESLQALSIREDELIRYTLNADFRIFLNKNGYRAVSDGVWCRLSEDAFRTLSEKHMLIHPIDLFIFSKTRS